MVIDFLGYVEMQRAEQAAIAAAAQAKKVQRANLEWILSDLLADLEAA